jgi:hypothetical protein
MKRLMAAIIGAGLMAFLLFDDQKHPSSKEIIPNEQALKAGTVDDNALMAKLLQDIKEIHIQ